MKIVIVESPAKAKTIEKYLGKGFAVRASVGHIRDLPKSNKDAVDVEVGFVPRYHLSDYSEASVTVALAFAGWSAARFLDRRAVGESGRRSLWQMALSLAALVNIKQDSVALAVGGGMVVSQRQTRRRRN